MNKGQLIATIASKTGHSSYKAEKALKTTL
jgi:nucleoid DNA-binding protein